MKRVLLPKMPPFLLVICILAFMGSISPVHPEFQKSFLPSTTLRMVEKLPVLVTQVVKDSLFIELDQNSESHQTKAIELSMLTSQLLVSLRNGDKAIGVLEPVNNSLSQQLNEIQTEWLRIKSLLKVRDLTEVNQRLDVLLQRMEKLITEYQSEYSSSEVPSEGLIRKFEICIQQEAVDVLLRKIQNTWDGTANGEYSCGELLNSVRDGNPALTIPKAESPALVHQLEVVSELWERDLDLRNSDDLDLLELTRLSDRLLREVDQLAVLLRRERGD